MKLCTHPALDVTATLMRRFMGDVKRYCNVSATLNVKIRTFFPVAATLQPPTTVMHRCHDVVCRVGESAVRARLTAMGAQ